VDSLRVYEFLKYWSFPKLDRITVAHLRATLDLAPIGMAGGMLLATLTFTLLLSSVPLLPLSVWYASAMVPLVGAALTWRRWRQIAPRRVSRRAIWKSAAWPLLAALPWGCGAFLVLGTTPNAELIYIAAAGTITLSAVGVLSHLYPAALAFTAANAMPMLVACLVQGDAEHLRLAGVLVGYCVVVLAFTVRTAHMSVEWAESLELLSARTKSVQAIFDNIPAGIAFIDKEAKVTSANRLALQLLELPPAMFDHREPSLTEVLGYIKDRGEYGTKADDIIKLHLDAVREGLSIRYERVRPNGTVVDVRGVAVEDIGYVMFYVDLTDRAAAEQRVAHLARHDALTGLPNRLSFRDALQEQLVQAGVATGDGAAGALLLLDLDRFKEVNDTLGHPVGDKVLVEVAARLRGCVEETDVIARLGGDEFAIILCPAVDVRERAQRLAQAIIAAIEEPFHIDRARLRVGVSIGIDVFAAQVCADGLVKRADMALYYSKQQGRGVASLFDPAMDRNASRRRMLTQELWDALDNNALHIEYQPIYSFESDRVVGYEALLRWRTLAGEVISPAEFIPLAEESGAIIAIGNWVIAQACQQAARWPEHIRVSVNLSLAQFRSPSLGEDLARAVKDTGLAPHRLEIEITESMMLQHVEGAPEVLEGLRGIGVAIALDDFGTGHSSFGTLRRRVFDRLKIDRCFVRDLDEQRDVALPLIRAMVQLGRTLGMEVTAEGVETQEQLLALRLEGCTEIQGYLIGKPAPPVVWTGEEIQIAATLRSDAA
jgi:diguanylate cyclase (GGDEF)-like protein